MMLFSEKLSAVRIEKLVQQFPDIASLAACHPNGGGVCVPGEDREVVDKIRSAAKTVSLYGKSGEIAVPGARTCILEL